MQKPLTEKRLENIALYYLEQFDTSAEKLRQVLTRRVRRQKIQGIVVDPKVTQWIENVVQKVTQLGYVNDERYAENAVRRLSQSGKSARFIQQKLMADGIAPDEIEKHLSTDEDLDRARVFAQKKHLGRDYQKDLAKLARAGFSYETAQEVLKGE